PSVIIATVERSLLVETGYTAGEALCGFLIASALAFVAAVLFVRFRTVEQGLFPLAITLKTTADRRHRAASRALARYRLVVEGRGGGADLVFPGAGQHGKRPQGSRGRLPRLVSHYAGRTGTDLP